MILTYAFWQLCEDDHFLIPMSTMDNIILFEAFLVIHFLSDCGGGYCHQSLSGLIAQMKQILTTACFGKAVCSILT